MARVRGAACCVDLAITLLALPVALVLIVTGNDWGPFMLGFCLLYLLTFTGPVRGWLFRDDERGP